MPNRRQPLMRRSCAAVLLPFVVLVAACGSDGDGLDADAADTAESKGADAADGGGPVANQDHWHAAFGVYVCDTFVEGISDVGPDAQGIHSHQDDLVHIHPFVEESSGARAVVQRFTDQVGIELADGRLGLPDGTVHADGDECPTGPGRVALFVWGADAPDDSVPEIVTADIGATRFREDRQRFVLAFAPEGFVPPQPPSTPSLDAPTDME